MAGKSQNAGIPIIGPVLNKIIGTRNDRFVKKYTNRVEAIGALEPRMRQLSDQELAGKLDEFRQRHDKGEKIDDILVEAFAVAREAMDRSVGIRNVLNPEAGFQAEWLPESVRGVYEKLRAEADAMEPLDPAAEGIESPWAGWNEPIPGWRRVEIPLELYTAVRDLYPESRPPFRARPFDVQLIGGMVLAGGKISEMKTGEGKTIVAPLATYLAAIQRMKVHVVTVNDYLVQRDRDWTAPYFRALGLTVGAIHPQHMQEEPLKRVMYHCDVVYGTTSEFGFDYLRDNMKRRAEDQVQQRRDFAIVDEVDSILIDEARTPLIISGMAHDQQPRYELADGLARHLVQMQKPWQDREDQVTTCKETIKGLEGDIRQVRDKGEVPALQSKLAAAKKELPELERERDQHTQYYELEPERKAAHLTHEGVAEAQKKAGMGSFYVDENMDVPHLLENALRAHAIYTRDKDYVVMNVPDRATGRNDPSVVIVDTNTGRPMIGRQWSDGLHQAVECKERVPIKAETQTIAMVTIQNFFKMYKSLSGMTGTADTEAQEFHDIYKLDVVSIPTNKPIARVDHDDTMYLRAKDKWESICDEIKRFHDAGRPILVGTTSVEKSEMLSQMLQRKHGIQHNVLNAKQHDREANIVEDAGQLGAVMIATNMAGRGTDIKLAKISREELLQHWLKRGLASRKLTVEATDEQVREDIYRKVASNELGGVNKREIEEMDFATLELSLLRHWAIENTWLGDGKVNKLSAEELRNELDTSGRFILHRVRWFETVEELGGLHVIGTERHESRRIDNQLRGRSGRQGDNGSSRFYVSLEDDLMKMFAGDTTMNLLSRMGMKEGEAIEHPMLSKSVERAQRKVEERNFQIRKNLLEYDEVREHQRQKFYGLRQQVLEGRDVKGLIFGYIEDAVDDAAGEYLDPDYRAQCAAEYAKSQLDCSIFPDRLRNKDQDEMETAIRVAAKEDARAMIDVTLGEYMTMEGSEVAVDFDSAGLVNWAKSRFGVELDAAELREGGSSERRQVQDLLSNAADEQIDKADLSGLVAFSDEDYGVHKLVEWVKRKFAFEVTAEDIKKAMDTEDQENEDGGPSEVILAKAREAYEQREIVYPVDFSMEMTQFLLRQNPQVAFEQLAEWANRRFDMGLTADEIKTTPPAKLREKLVEQSKAFVESGRLDREIAEAQAVETDEALEDHLKSRFGQGLTDRMRYLEGEEREHAVRARVENLLRSELLHFERTILIDTLDQLWKDHLYEMDQLRDAIGFRAFSQQDPRIEFKREGARLYKQMEQAVRDRVSDYIFKARISPTPQPAPQPVPAGAGGRPPGGPQGGPQGGAAGGGRPPAGGGGGVAGGFSGPGFGNTGGGMYEPPSGGRG